MDAQASPNKEEPSSSAEQSDSYSLSSNSKESTKLSFEDFMLKYNRILNRRTRVFQGRQSLSQMRQALRQLRRETYELETDFLSTLENQFPQHVIDRGPSLAEFLEKIREIRYRTSWEEHAYDKNEDAVAIDEHALSVEEHRLFQEFATSLFPTEFRADQSVSMPEILLRQPQTNVPAPNVPAAVHEYETRIGQASILRETLDLLDSEREEYIEKEQQGLKLDSDELEFLQSYKEVHEQAQHQLRELEEDIKRMEPAALETGQLSPSARYIPVLAPPSPLSLPATILSLNQQDTDTMTQMSIDLQGLSGTTLDTTNSQSNTATGSESPSAASINRWLASLPTLTQQVSKTTSTITTFTTRGGSRLVQYCRDQVFGPREKPTSTKSVPPPFSNQDSHNLQEGWVNVTVTTPRIDPLPHENTNLPPNYPQNIERVGSDQPQTHNEVLKQFAAFDLASSMPAMTGGQLPSLPIPRLNRQTNLPDNQPPQSDGDIL